MQLVYFGTWLFRFLFLTVRKSFIGRLTTPRIATGMAKSISRSLVSSRRWASAWFDNDVARVVRLALMCREAGSKAGAGHRAPRMLWASARGVRPPPLIKLLDTSRLDERRGRRRYRTMPMPIAGLIPTSAISTWPSLWQSWGLSDDQ